MTHKLAWTYRVAEVIKAYDFYRNDGECFRV